MKTSGSEEPKNANEAFLEEYEQLCRKHGLCIVPKYGILQLSNSLTSFHLTLGMLRKRVQVAKRLRREEHEGY